MSYYWLARKKNEHQGIQKGLTPDGGPSPKRPLDHLLANHFSGSRFFFGFEQGVSKYHPNISKYWSRPYIMHHKSPKKNDKLLNFEAGGYATFHQNLHISSIIVVLLTQLAGMPRHSGCFFLRFSGQMCLGPLFDLRHKLDLARKPSGIRYDANTSLNLSSSSHLHHPPSWPGRLFANVHRITGVIHHPHATSPWRSVRLGGGHVLRSQHLLSRWRSSEVCSLCIFVTHTYI